MEGGLTFGGKIFLGDGSSEEMSKFLVGGHGGTPPLPTPYSRENPKRTYNKSGWLFQCNTGTKAKNSFLTSIIQLLYSQKMTNFTPTPSSCTHPTFSIINNRSVV